MGKRMGRYTVVMERKPAILGYAAICGKKESEGPLGAAFDLTYEDTTLGEKSWEKAESRLQKEAVNCAMKKAGVTAGAVDYIFAGDLLNQCISSTFGLRSLGIPFLGQYGACSTMAQTLAMSSFLVDLEEWRTFVLQSHPAISARRSVSSAFPWNTEGKEPLPPNGR